MDSDTCRGCPFARLFGLPAGVCADTVHTAGEKSRSGPVGRPCYGTGMYWAIDKCIRLITGKRNSGGLISPRSIRSIAILFLLMPLGELCSGYFRAHMLLAIVQTAVYICIFIELRRFAARRESIDA
jgi:hypothetical protein